MKKKKKNNNLKQLAESMTINTQISNTIGKSFCFQSQCDDLKLTYLAYEYYKSHLKDTKDILKEKVIIALDTNLLLNLYKMSIRERTEFLRFIDKNASRILIPAQVEIEYLRHRVNYIQDFQRTLQELKTTAKKCINTLKDACTTASTQIKQLGSTKVVANDIPATKEHIQKLIEFIESNSFSDDYKKNLDEVYKPLDETLTAGIDLLLKQAIYELDDPVMASLAKVNILKKLTDEEISYLKEHYDFLLKIFNENKTNTAEKENYSFPGCGDRKKVKAGCEPYGDFLIYHELLAYMQQSKKDVYFLTKDVTKSDWIKSDGKPFKHYLVDIYKNTNQMLYIFNAEKFIPLTFAPVIETEETDADGELAVESSIEDSSNANPIDLDNAAREDSGHLSDSQEESYTRLSYLRTISEKRFMDELEVASLWANNYGDGYVSKTYFIYGILGPKHFHYGDSKRILEELKNKGYIEEYTEHKDDRELLCLKIIKSLEKTE